MTIKYNGRDLAKRIINGREVEKVMYNGVQIRPSQSPTPNYLCFTAESANSTVQLNRIGYPFSVSLETSTDGTTWNDYTIGSTITLSSVGDSIYFRNKSENATSFTTGFQSYYNFSMTGTISASGDVNYLLCKNGTTTLSNYCFVSLFEDCISLTTPPLLSATTLADYCYSNMFAWCESLATAPSLPATTISDYGYRNMFYRCSSLTAIPSLPATTLGDSCYESMFAFCDLVKISETQTGEYQTPYRIPSTGTGTMAQYALSSMFADTGGTFTGTPSINQTYYTSNTVI